MQAEVSKNSNHNLRWNPYLVGAGIGMLSWIAFAVVNTPIGMSTQISSIGSLCVVPFAGEQGITQNAYWSKFPLKLDYPMLFLIGTFLGSLVSVMAGRSFKLEAVPRTWAERFGSAPVPRLLVAFTGGTIIMYGARMAGGCTSGHGISGSLQLAVSSWVFFLVLFGAGIATALLIFGFGSSKSK